MPHTLKWIRRIATVAVAPGLAVLVLAACGSSSSKTTSSASASAATTTTIPGTTQPQGGRLAPLRECLQKQGITLPERKPGTPGGRPTLPSGISRAQFEAAVKKCTGGNLPRRGPGSLAGSLKVPAVHAALNTFANCMRQHGVNVPPPNTSGKGPVFNTSGLNVASSQFHSAQVACTPALRSAIRAAAGSTGAAP
jgi:hypothetical protein